MADPKMRAGIRFNHPVAKYMKFEMDMLEMELDVYITGLVDGNELTLKSTIPRSGWSPVQEDAKKKTKRSVK